MGMDLAAFSSNPPMGQLQFHHHGTEHTADDGLARVELDLLLHPATLRRNEIVAAGGRDWRSTIVKIGIFLLGRSRSSKYHEAFMITLHWGKSSIEGFLEILHTVADQSSTATELQLSTFHFLHHYYTSGYHGITDEDENISLMKVLEKILSRAELDIERKLFSLSLLSVILGKSVQIETFEYEVPWKQFPGR